MWAVDLALAASNSLVGEDSCSVQLGEQDFGSGGSRSRCWRRLLSGRPRLHFCELCPSLVASLIRRLMLTHPTKPT